MISEARFACDAMLGGLARWLRAAGYDAAWQHGIEDWDLVRLALRDQRILPSSDTGIFKIGQVRDGDVRGLFIPHGLDTQQQLALVLREFRLAPREPRCMACGGKLVEVLPDQVQDRVPPRSFAWAKQFWQCGSCERVFWQGTHWQRIQACLDPLRTEGQRRMEDGG